MQDKVTGKITHEHLNEKDSNQFIVFRTGNEEFAIAIENVLEIIKSGLITPIPNSPHYIRGIINVRGEIVTVIDIKERFPLKTKRTAELKHIIVTRHDDSLYGLMVEEVIEVLRINNADIKPAPELIEKINKEYIKGVVSKDDRLLIILNLSLVLAKEGLLHLAKQKKLKAKQDETLKNVINQKGEEETSP